MNRADLLEQVIEGAMIPSIIRSVTWKNGLRTGAVFSLEAVDGEPIYRYILWWIWDAYLPLWLFAMLNPSTATAWKLDPTLLRQAERTRRGGGGGILVVNAGAVRETKSALAVRHSDPIGPHNRDWIKCVVRQCDMHVCGWGPLATKFGGDVLLSDIFLEEGLPLHRLELTQAGHPKHPLYTSYAVPPTPFILRK